MRSCALPILVYFTRNMRRSVLVVGTWRWDGKKDVDWTDSEQASDNSASCVTGTSLAGNSEWYGVAMICCQLYDALHFQALTNALPFPHFHFMFVVSFILLFHEYALSNSLPCCLEPRRHTSAISRSGRQQFLRSSVTVIILHCWSFLEYCLYSRFLYTVSRLSATSIISNFSIPLLTKQNISSTILFRDLCISRRKQPLNHGY